MTLDKDDLRAARFVLAEFTRRRRLAGQPIPTAILRLHHHLVSVDGPEHRVARRESETAAVIIDSRQAAEIIGCSERHVRRIATDLDGRQIAGRWAFDHQAVTEYALHKGDSHGKPRPARRA